MGTYMRVECRPVPLLLRVLLTSLRSPPPSPLLSHSPSPARFTGRGSRMGAASQGRRRRTRCAASCCGCSRGRGWRRRGGSGTSRWRRWALDRAGARVKARVRARVRAWAGSRTKAYGDDDGDGHAHAMECRPVLLLPSLRPAPAAFTSSSPSFSPSSAASCHRPSSLSSPVGPVVLAVLSSHCLALLGWEAAGREWWERTT